MYVCSWLAVLIGWGRHMLVVGGGGSRPGVAGVGLSVSGGYFLSRLDS